MPDDPQSKPTRSAADKERSKQQSRPVAGGKGAQRPAGGTAKKQGGQTPRGQVPRGQVPRNAGGGGGQRPPRSGGGGAVPAAPARRAPTTLLTWGFVILVLVVVVVLVVVNIVSGNKTTTSGLNYGQAPASLTSQLADIPLKTFNTVGVTSSATPVTGPTLAKPPQPLLTFKGKPGVFYFGAEYCPYCAAERWALIAALDRFGSFSGLGLMKSSSSDVYPSTNTFTFAKATYTSPYLVFEPDEYYTNDNPTGNGYTILKQPTAQQAALIKKYENSTFMGSGVTEGSFPFIDFGNKYLVAGASYDPAVLQNLTWSEIAGQLDDPTQPVAQAILATSNYLSAAICATDGDQPAKVCTSAGVKAAVKSLKAS